ncbi:MAG: RbsD/FucU family protein [Verrucomicrobiota bacterium]|nr:RbsD/FucU family protein [Verrucomicrobiota bacterium]
MLKHQLIHPKINEVLGRAGHGSKVLIADGNYPASSALGSRAELVSLNLSPGIPTCSQVLAALVTAVPIEAADLMMYQTTGPYALTEEPPVWEEFRQVFRDSNLEVDFGTIERFAFYEAAGQPDQVLTIQTADQQKFANILVTIGVRGVD